MLNFTPNPARPRIEGPSDKEIQVLRLAAQGMSTDEIAASIHRSAATIASHLKNVCRKLDVSGKARSTTAAVAKAYKQGLLQ